MVAGPNQVYAVANRKIIDNTIDLNNDTLQAILLDDAHNVDLASDAVVNDVVADEVNSGTFPDYSRQPVANQSVAKTGDNTAFTSDAISFGVSVSIDARYLVIAKNTGNDAIDEVLFICDLSGGGNLSSTDGQFQITPNAIGWHRWDPNSGTP